MKKIFFLISILGASLSAIAQEEIFDVNFALASNGSSATASSGTAASAIDGNTGTRWESEHAVDPQVWTLDMGQARIFNTIEILWEGAYAKTFDIDLSDDGETWTNATQVIDQTLADFPYLQIIEITKSTARYVRFTGNARGTNYGYSFWEFRVYLAGASVLTSIQLDAPAIAKVGEGAALSVKALDQHNKEMDVEISYEITPATAGSISNGVYVPAMIGNARIVAYSGEILSAPVEIFGYEGDNLALSTDIVTDNKVIAQSDFAPSGTDAFHAVDTNEGSIWQGSATNGTEEDEASRTFDAWFVVDLGANYTIDLVSIKFEGACSQEYHVDFSFDNTNWVSGYNFVGTDGINARTDMLSGAMLENNLKVRYVRFWSTKAATKWGVKIYDMKVFGHDYINPDDHEAPVMVSAELVSKDRSSAVISVEATDDEEVAKFHVVDEANAIDAKYAPKDGQIKVTGLTQGTVYHFVITALDGAMNESENSVQVDVETDAYSMVPSEAAPAPEWPAAQVKSLYSDAYALAPASVNSYNEWWWNAPTLTVEAIDGDDYLHYDLFQEGMIGVQFSEISVADMEKFHIDVFASVSGSLTIRLICAGDPDAINDTKQTLNLTGGQWNSFDFKLSDFNAAHNWSRLFQYAIEGYKAGGLVGEHISVDNIYCYTSAIEGLEAVEAAPKAQKVIENGRLIILKNGIRYDATGQIVK